MSLNDNSTPEGVTESSTALIVDDEPLVRKRLRTVIPWDEHGIHQLLEASDGMEALELVRNFAPAIIITDIVMPRMNGIEFIRQLRNFGNHANIMVLSGHDEFEYARQCMKLGVRDFVLKPLDRDSLNSLIAETLRSVRETAASGVSRLSRINPEYRRILDALQPNSKVNQSTTHRVTILSFRSGRVDGSTTYRNEVAQLLTRPIESHTTIQQWHNFGLHEILGILVTSKSVAGELRERVTHLPTLTATVGGVADIPLSQVFDELSLQRYIELSRHTRRAASILGLPEEKQIVTEFVEDAEIMPLETDRVRSIENNVVIRIAERDRPGATAEVSRLVELVAACSASYRTLVYVLLDLVLYVLAFSSHGDQKLSLEVVSERIQNTDSQDEIIDTVVQVLFENAASNRTRSLKTRHCEAAKRYIDDHFDDPSLSLSTVARAVTINPSYLSSLFREETGMAMTEYLTMRRLEHALTLMSQGDNRTIFEIAEVCGYRDPYYFSKCFKRAYGTPPSVVLKRSQS